MVNVIGCGIHKREICQPSMRQTFSEDWWVMKGPHWLGESGGCWLPPKNDAGGCSRDSIFLVIKRSRVVLSFKANDSCYISRFLQKRLSRGRDVVWEHLSIREHLSVRPKQRLSGAVTEFETWILCGHSNHLSSSSWIPPWVVFNPNLILKWVKSLILWFFFRLITPRNRHTLNDQFKAVVVLVRRCRGFKWIMMWNWCGMR